MNEKPLLNKLQRYVEGISRGRASFPAAKLAGYSDSYARVIATRTKNNAIVAKTLESVRTEGMRMAIYDLARAMKEADDAASFAREHKNPMAVVKAVELRSRLSGLLVDRVEIVNADLRGALEAAEQRVIQITPVADVTNGTLVPAAWLPRIAGDVEVHESNETPTDRQAKVGVE